MPLKVRGIDSIVIPMFKKQKQAFELKYLPAVYNVSSENPEILFWESIMLTLSQIISISHTELGCFRGYRVCAISTNCRQIWNSSSLLIQIKKKFTDMLTMLLFLLNHLWFWKIWLFFVNICNSTLTIYQAKKLEVIPDSSIFSHSTCNLSVDPIGSSSKCIRIWYTYYFCHYQPSWSKPWWSQACIILTTF